MKIYKGSKNTPHHMLITHCAHSPSSYLLLLFSSTGWKQYWNFFYYFLNAMEVEEKSEITKSTLVVWH